MPASAPRFLPGLIAALALLVAPPLCGAETAREASPADLDKLVHVLFSAPALEQATLSPDGAHLAFICEVKTRKVAGVYDLVHHTQKLAGLENNQSVSWIRWIGSDRLLLGLLGIYVSNLALDDVREVEIPDREIRWELQGWYPQKPNQVLLRAYSHSDLFTDLYTLNLPSRRINLLESNPGRVAEWVLDATGVVRLAVVPETSETQSFLLRDGPATPWRAEPLPSSADPLCFDADGQTVLLAHRDGLDRQVVQDYDLLTHRLAGAPLIAHPFCDIIPTQQRDNRTGAPIALHYDTEKPETYWLDPQYRQVDALLRRSFPHEVVQILGSMSGNRVLFMMHSDTTTPAFYSLDLAHPSISKLIDAMPAASRYAWAPTLPITFPARDGADVHGYLTLPLHHAAGRPLPLVALTHGGPRERDTWTFNSEVQYLAALGYAVLQVNYRGSIGYGRAYELNNALEVCEKSVDDVVDGINWAIKSGQADPKRIAVYGGSYGGYISLAIATRYPDLPAAAVGFAGVYDWVSQYKNERSNSYEKMAFLFKNSTYYIDPKTAPDRFRAVSPLPAAAKVRCPVLLMHGGADEVVDIAQTKALAAALRNAGKSVQVVKDAEVIHGLPHQEERFNFYRKLGEFLLKNVPPDPAS